MRRLAMTMALCALFGACTSVHSLAVNPSGIHDIGPDEGLVFGSIRVELTDEASGGIFAKDSKRFKYRINVAGPPEAESNPLVTNLWQITVEPDQELIFVARLPVGEMTLGTARPEPLFGSEFGLAGSFEVSAEKPTYIGRLLLTFPASLGTFTQIDVSADNKLEEARSEVIKAYGDAFENPLVKLIKVTNDRARLVTGPGS
jgi:hypothetical protein